MKHQMSQDLLLTSITHYFDKRSDLKKCLSDIVNGRSLVSLRVIDWFLTHYTRTYNVIYWIDDKKDKLSEVFNVVNAKNLRKVHLYLDYRAQLKSYTKLNFDPFRRHNRITFLINSNIEPHEVLETTVGQLNFFRWAFQNHLFEYICNHLQNIEDNMSQFIHDRRIQATMVSSSTEETLLNNSNAKKKKDKRIKTARTTKTNTGIITAPCCLHFS